MTTKTVVIIFYWSIIWILEQLQKLLMDLFVFILLKKEWIFVLWCLFSQSMQDVNKLIKN